MKKGNVYRLCPQLQISIENTQQICITSKGKKQDYPLKVLSILSFFESPQSLAEMGEKIKHFVFNKTQILEYFLILQRLIQNDILLPENAITSPPLPEITNSWGKQKIHKNMLNDKTRTMSFEQAIASCVKDKIVLDIGCGTGILSFFALKHGAKHVYAIDSNYQCIRYAQAIAKANAFNDITFIHKSCFETELPEKADVLISEVIGNSPLGENILAIFEDAKKRLLKPNAKIIPQTLKILAYPVEFNKEIFSDFYFTSENIAHWENNYHINFDALLLPEININNKLFIEPDQVNHFTILGPAVVIDDYNFQDEIENFSLKKDMLFNINKKGILSGLLIFFETNLTKTIKLHTDPNNIHNDNHWKYLIYPFNERKRLVSEKNILQITVSSSSHKRSEYQFTLSTIE